MLEVFSTGITVAENTAIPFNNVSLKKGCTVELTGTSTIQFNKCGVYMVSCDCSASTSEDAGLLAIQLYKNGVAQPQAQSSSTGETDDTTTMSFTTLVQVQDNNSCCCCSSPTVIQILNSGEEDMDIASINCCVTKIC